MAKAERFVGATIVQLFSLVGIDVIHHEGNLFLRQMIEAGSFRKHSADQSMVDFNRPFLVRASGIAVIHPCA